MTNQQESNPNLIAGLDIETLDLNKTTAVVMDIGISVYDLSKEMEVGKYSLRPCIMEQLVLGRTIDLGTVQFHINNYHETREGLIDHLNNPPSVNDTIKNVHEMMTQIFVGVSEIWINGLSFDPVVLETLFACRGLKTLPWSFRKEVDVRSFRTLFKKHGISLLSDTSVSQHEAVADAQWNVGIPLQVHRFLQTKTVTAVDTTS
jgi:hypothetical protein